MPSSAPIVISGPSGVGKGTLIKKLFDAHPDTFAFTVSHTTRSPRVGEADGVSYFFVDRSKFADLIAEGAFVEHATFGSNQYGTSKQTIADQTAKGRIVVLDIEMNGVKQMKSNSGIDARYVFISPPKFEDLEKRLRGRGTEKDEDVQKRLEQAKAELEYAETGVHDKIIVNDDLEVAYRELESFIFQE
ncbi:Guanylate kinase [Penicillium macrosclerotiorum]|uniref:Guanylate kinase n=1 Tax=Penicillium macrosclerotiorum TaxID=303699 RepID=UPI0025491FB8|nr:Guanylate kinase [Penicillium macrosclerotiorum]KAJ5698164.1 Guanylate kinase [Penicillium macrosclerotiorum]